MKPFRCPTADGVTIDGALFPAVAPERGVVVLAHGLPTAGPSPEAAADEGYPGLARRLTALGYTTVLFNFRGTGASGGHLEIDRWPDDLGAVLDHLDRSPERRSRYGVVGFSAGGAAAILRSAADERLDPLITMAAPADYGFLPLNTNVAQWFQLYRELGMIREGYSGTPESWAAGFERVRPDRAIGSSRARRLAIVHGTADDLVPVAHAERLAAAAGGRAEKILISGGIHQMRRDERAVAVLVDLLKRLVPAGGDGGA
ncbi:MAG: alpha/beta fold hydrolase [Myxococcales bacterium]|nr:alpha/beta fold hydrolase [Myxococcales bacterium]